MLASGPRCLLFSAANSVNCSLLRDVALPHQIFFVLFVCLRNFLHCKTINYFFYTTYFNSSSDEQPKRAAP